MSEALHMFQDVLPTPLTSWCLLPDGYRAKLPEESRGAVAALVKGVVQAAHLGDDKGLTQYVEKYFTLKMTGHRFTQNDRVILADTFLRKAIDISEVQSMPYVDVARYIKISADVLRAEPALHIVLDWRPLMQLFIRHAFIATSVLLTDNYENDQRFGAVCDDAFLVFAQYYGFSEWASIRAEIERYRARASMRGRDELFRYLCLLASFLPHTTTLPLMRQYLQTHPVDKHICFERLVHGGAFASIDDSMKEIATTITRFLHATHDAYQELVDELLGFLEGYQSDGLALFVIQTLGSLMQTRPDVDFTTARCTRLFIYRLSIYSGIQYQIGVSALSDLMFFSEPKEGSRDELIIPEWVNIFTRYPSITTGLITLMGEFILTLIYAGVRHRNFLAMTSAADTFISAEEFKTNEIAAAKNPYYMFLLHHFKSMPQSLEKLGLPAKQFMFSVIHNLAMHYTTQKCYVRMIMPIYQGILPFLFVVDLSMFEPHAYALRDIMLNVSNYEFAQRTDFVAISGLLFAMYPSIMLPRLVWLVENVIHRPEECQKSYKFTYYNIFLSITTLVGVCFDNSAYTPDAHAKESPLAHFVDDTWAPLCGVEKMRSLTPEFLVCVLSSYSQLISTMDLQCCQFSLLLFLHLFASIPMSQQLLEAHPQLVDLISLYLDKVLSLLEDFDKTSKTRPPAKEADPQSTDLSFKALYAYNKSRNAINVHILRISFASLLANMSAASISKLIVPPLLRFIKENELLTARKEVQAAFSGITMGILSGVKKNGAISEAAQRNEILTTIYKAVLTNYQLGACTLKWTLALLQSFVRFDYLLHLYPREESLRSFLVSLMENPANLFADSPLSQAMQHSSNSKYAECPQTVYICFLKTLRAAVRALSIPYPIDWSVGQSCDKFFPISLCTPQDRELRRLYHHLKLFPRPSVAWSAPSAAGRKWVLHIMLSFNKLFADKMKPLAGVHEVILTYKLIFKILPLLSHRFYTESADPDSSSVRGKHIVHMPVTPHLKQYMEEFNLPTDKPLFAVRYEQLRKYKFLPSDPRIYMYHGIDAEEETREDDLRNQMLRLSGVASVLDHQEMQEAPQDHSCPFPLSHTLPEELSDELLKILLAKLEARLPSLSPRPDHCTPCYGDIVDIYRLGKEMYGQKTGVQEPESEPEPSACHLLEPPLKRAVLRNGASPVDYLIPEAILRDFLQLLSQFFQKSLVEPRYAKIIAHVIEIAITNKTGYNLTKTLIFSRTLSNKTCPAAFHVPVVDFHCTYERNLRAMGLHLARYSFGETDNYNNCAQLLELYFQLVEYILVFSLMYDENVSKIAVYVLGRVLNTLDIEGDCYRFYSKLIEPCCKYLSIHEGVESPSEEACFDQTDISKIQGIIMEEVSERLELIAKSGVQITEEIMNKILSEVMANSGLKGDAADMLAYLRDNDNDKDSDNDTPEPEEERTELSVTTSINSHMTYLRAIQTVRYFMFLSQSLTYCMKKNNRFSDFVELFSHLYACKNERVHSDANEMGSYMEYWEPTHPAIRPDLTAFGVLSIIGGSSGRDAHNHSLIAIYRARLPPTVCPGVDAEAMITRLPLSGAEAALVASRREKEAQNYIELLADSLIHMSASQDMHGDGWKSIHIAAKCHILAITYGLPTAIEFIDRLFDCVLMKNFMLMDPLLSGIVELTIFYKPYDSCNYKYPDTMAGFYEFKDRIVDLARSKHGIRLATFDDFRAYLQKEETQKKLLSIVLKFLTLSVHDKASEDTESESPFIDLDAVFLTIWTNLCAIAGDESSLAIFLLKHIREHLVAMTAEDFQKCSSHILAEVTGAAVRSFKYLDSVQHRVDEVSTLINDILMQVIQKGDEGTEEAWQLVVTLAFESQTVEILRATTSKYLARIRGLFDEPGTNTLVCANALILIGFFIDAASGINPDLQTHLAQEAISFILQRNLYVSLKILRESTTAVLGVALNFLLKSNKAEDRPRQALLDEYCSVFHRAVDVWIANPECDEKRQTNIISTIIQGTTCVSIYGKNALLSHFIVDQFLDALIGLQTHKDLSEVRSDASAMVLLVANMEISLDLTQDLLFRRLPELLQKYAGRWRSMLCVYELAIRLLKTGMLKLFLEASESSYITLKETIICKMISTYVLEYGLTAQHDELVYVVGEFFLTVLTGMGPEFQRQAISELIAICRQRGEPRKKLIVVECIAAFLKSWNDHVPVHTIDALLFLAKMSTSRHEMLAKATKAFFLWFWSIHHKHFDRISGVLNDAQMLALRSTRFSAAYMV